MHHTKIGRNAPCPCGSGTKHKRCCARNPSPVSFRRVDPRGGEPALAPDLVHAVVVFRVADAAAVRASLDAATALGFVRREAEWAHLSTGDGEQDFSVRLEDGLLMLDSWCESTAEAGRRMVESIVGRAARYVDTSVLEMRAIAPSPCARFFLGLPGG